MKQIPNKHFNHNNLAVENSVTFTIHDIEIIANSFVDFKQNDHKTREFLASILSEVLIDSKKIEFDDIADRHLKHIADSTSTRFYSLDTFSFY